MKMDENTRLWLGIASEAAEVGHAATTVLLKGDTPHQCIYELLDLAGYFALLRSVDGVLLRQATDAWRTMKANRGQWTPDLERALEAVLLLFRVRVGADCFDPGATRDG